MKVGRILYEPQDRHTSRKIIRCEHPLVFVQDCVKASWGTWIRMIRMDLVLILLLPQGIGLQG